MKINKIKIKKNSINCKFDWVFLLSNFIQKKKSYTQLPDAFVKNNKQIQFNLPRNYEDSQYIKRLPYISNKGPDVENKVLNALKNKFLNVTSMMLKNLMLLIQSYVSLQLRLRQVN